MALMLNVVNLFRIEAKKFFCRCVISKLNLNGLQLGFASNLRLL